MTSTIFEQAFQEMQKEAYSIAKAHGFHDREDNPLFVPTALALIMSEGAEALEAHRKGHFHELPGELADIILRCMNLAESLGLNLGGAVVQKSAFNAGRPYKHGNKLY